MATSLLSQPSDDKLISPSKGIESMKTLCSMNIDKQKKYVFGIVWVNEYTSRNI
jgi:hypothetical protein